MDEINGACEWISAEPDLRFLLDNIS